MPKLPTPFSFISWEECYHSGYDHFCQDLWDWSDYVDPLYPPEAAFFRLPWNTADPLYDVPDCGEEIYRCEGTVSVWAMLSTDMAPEDYFLADHDACEWEPFEYPAFWDDLGFIVYPWREDYAAANAPVKVSLLLEEFPGDTTVDSFKEELISTCAAKSIDTICGLYFIYDFDYYGSPVFGQFCSGRVKFLGAFNYEG